LWGFVVTTIDYYIEKIFPYLFLTLSFTIPLVKGIPGIVHVTLIALFVIQIFYRRNTKLKRGTIILQFFFLAVTAISLIYSSDIFDGLQIFKSNVSYPWRHLIEKFPLPSQRAAVFMLTLRAVQCTCVYWSLPGVF
jgi:hypothetical protein